MFGNWRDIGENIGGAAKSFVQDTGEVILGGLCNIYSKYPKGLLVNPYGQGLMNGLCSDLGTPIPPPSSPSWTGGQCEVLYNCVVRFRSTNLTTFQQYEYTNTQGNVSGAITGIEREYVRYLAPGTSGSANSLGATEYKVYITNSQGGRRYTANFFFTDGSTWDEAVLISVERADGLPDNCGDYPPEYPPDPPFDNNDFQYDVTINNYDGDSNITGSDTYNLNFTNVEGDFNANLNLGGVDFTTNYNGFDFSTTTSSSGGGGGANENLEEKEQEEKEEEEKEVPGIKYALVTVTTLPLAGKTILQSSSVNNTYFAGYFSWLIDINGVSYRLEEQPIRKIRTAFQAPDNATGYAYYAVNDARLQVVEYTQQEDS